MQSRDTIQAAAGQACPACGYDLGGLRPGACPECGRAFTLRDLWRADADRAQRWMSLRRTTRSTARLWVSMMVGLVVLRVLEGQGLSGWLGALGAAGFGALVAGLQRRWISAGERDQVRHPFGPSRAMRWSIGANATAAVFVAIPVAGMALLLIIGLIAGSVAAG